jgi:uncharacterized membrane protein HdeD (DUF308 family)
MEKELTPDQSLKLIDDMLKMAKQSFQRMSFYFLLWGGLLMVATLVEYFMGRAGIPNGWLGWPILGTLGGIVAGVHGAREGKAMGASTFADRVFMWLWTAFTITLILLIVSMVASGQRPGPVVSILTGMPTFITGALLRFRPLQVGGVVFWVLGLISWFVWPEHGALLFGIALLVGYIVPGYLLKKQEDGLRTT